MIKQFVQKKNCQCIFAENENTETNGLDIPFDPEPDVPKVLGRKRDAFYHMGLKKRGKCLIFYQKLGQNNSLNISLKDVSVLKKTFENLQMEVLTYEDFTLEKIEATLLEVSKEDHSNSSCFICCFLTCESKFSILNMLKYFKCDACLSLAGKPKIFIIQAYEMNTPNPGLNHNSMESTDSGGPLSPRKRPKIERIPIFSDILTVTSTFSKRYIFDNGEQSSLFIQVLCHALLEYSEEKDLVSILTMVNYELIYSFPQQTTEKDEYSYFQSSLTKRLNFPKLK